MDLTGSHATRGMSSVGAIGRQVALQLAAVGVPWLQLIDPDEVAPENLACQGYLEDDIGCLKVDATSHLCRQINSTPEVIAIPSRFQRSRDVGNAVFCCVDSIETRRLIWRAVQDKVDIFIDGRMSAEVLRVLVACDLASREHYPTTLFNGEEAYRGSCTAKSTIYCTNIAAGLMLSTPNQAACLDGIDATEHSVAHIPIPLGT